MQTLNFMWFKKLKFKSNDEKFTRKKRALGNFPKPAVCIKLVGTTGLEPVTSCM